MTDSFLSTVWPGRQPIVNRQSALVAYGLVIFNAIAQFGISGRIALDDAASAGCVVPAEKVERAEEHCRAMEMGAGLFQGDA